MFSGFKMALCNVGDSNDGSDNERVDDKEEEKVAISNDRNESDGPSPHTVS